MSTYDWKQFIKRIPIKASPKAIYDAWATQQGLESWFLRLAQFFKEDGTIRPKNSYIEAGDRYIWRWFGYSDAATEEEKILAANGWDMVQFGFSGGCIVTVSIIQEEGETICRLVQDMPMPARPGDSGGENEKEQQHLYIECGKGWAFYLTNLKSILEGGLDLRNKNIKLGNLVNS